MMSWLELRLIRRTFDLASTVVVCADRIALLRLCLT